MNAKFTCHPEDGGYFGPKLRNVLDGVGDKIIEIAKRSGTAEGLEILPSRMGRRTHFRKAWMMRQTGRGLGTIDRLSRSLDQHCPHPLDDQAALKML